jgi:hypothetical protein
MTPLFGHPLRIRILPTDPQPSCTLLSSSLLLPAAWYFRMCTLSVASLLLTGSLVGSAGLVSAVRPLHHHISGARGSPGFAERNGGHATGEIFGGPLVAHVPSPGSQAT